MRTFCVGDIHGAYRALRQVLDRAKFDIKNDRLIVLGDVVDGWPYVYKTLDFLLTIPNLIFILGNHDLWYLDWGKRGWENPIWLQNGGYNTVCAYGKEWSDVPKEHIKLVENAHLYFLDEDDRLFVHAGINPDKLLKEQTSDIFLWDRELFKNTCNKYYGIHEACVKPVVPYEEIFIGHTPTILFGTDKPIHVSNLWCLDTGAGWDGKLTLMDVDTKEYWQSDNVKELFKDVTGRC